MFVVVVAEEFYMAMILGTMTPKSYLIFAVPDSISKIYYCPTGVFPITVVNQFQHGTNSLMLYTHDFTTLALSLKLISWMPFKLSIVTIYIILKTPDRLPLILSSIFPKYH